MIMDIVMLVQPQHQPIPEGITLIRNFGSEKLVIDGDLANCIDGDVMVLSGDTKSFVEWLTPFDSVWLNENPAIYDWQQYHIKG